MISMAVTKKAEPTKNVEDSMASLVYSQLQDQLPELFERLLGFQLLESRNEGKRNLGMLAYNIGNKYYYMPAIFLNGFLKPFILMFDLDKKSFIPATEEMVRYLIKPQKSMEVEVQPEDKDQQVVSNPNLYQFRTSPLISKLGSLYDKTNGAGSIGVAGMIAIRDAIKKTAEEKKKLKFMDFFKEASRKEKVAFSKMLKQSHELLEKVVQQYPDFMSKLAQEEPEEKPKKYETELSIKTDPSPALTPEQNGEIYNKGIFIKDLRKERSIIAPNQLDTDYGNVNENGIYKVLTSGAQWKEMLCLINPITPSGTKQLRERECPETTIVDLSTKDCCFAPSHDVMAKRTDSHWNQVWINTVPIDKAVDGQHYILLIGDAEYRQNGCFSGPFKHVRTVVNSNNLATLLVENDCGCPFKIVVSPRGTSSIDPLKEENELIVTQDARLLPVNRPICRSENKLGGFMDLVNMLFDKGIIKVDITKIGDEYTIAEDGSVVKRAAFKDSLIHLIADKNMSEEDARYLLDKRGSYLVLDPIRVKQATSVAPQDRLYREINNDVLPSVMERPFFNDDAYVQTRLGRPQGNPNMVVPDNVDYDTRERDIQLALDASSTGEQDIFDSALIGILGKGQNIDERIKEMIPVLNKAVHMLGILLFSLWWNTESYQEDFSTDELYELEQSIMDTFKTLGNLTLQLSLKKKIYGDV